LDVVGRRQVLKLDQGIARLIVGENAWNDEEEEEEEKRRKKKKEKIPSKAASHSSSEAIDPLGAVRSNTTRFSPSILKVRKGTGEPLLLKALAAAIPSSFTTRNELEG
jgi:hypothetical protein